MLIYFHGHLGQNSKKPGILEKALGEPVVAPRYHDAASFKTAIVMLAVSSVSPAEQVTPAVYVVRDLFSPPMEK